MKNKDKLMYVSAAVVAAGSIAGAKTTTVKAAEVQKVNADSNANLNNKAEQKATAQDKAATKQIAQDKSDIVKTQDQVKQAQADKAQVESQKTQTEATLPAKQEAMQTAKSNLDNAKSELTHAQTKQEDLTKQYDSSYENNVKSAQAAKTQADQKVQNLEGQVQTAQNKQTDLIGQRTNAESEVKANTETLNNVNTHVNGIDCTSKAAQDKFNNVQKDYNQIQGELNAKESASAKAENDLKQNETDLNQSKKTLSDLQTKDNDLAKTVNDTQAKLEISNKDLANVNNDISQSQNKLNDVTKQANDVNSKLSQATAKRDEAKSALDQIRESAQNVMILPDSYIKAAKKWDYISNEDRKNFNDDQFTKEMYAASIDGWKLNHYKSNEKDKKHMVDLNNLTADEQLEINNFALNLINQARAQLGNKPRILNRSAMKFANDVANNYRTNNTNSLRNGGGHDVKAITAAARKYGLNDANNWYELLGRENFSTQAPYEAVTDYDPYGAYHVESYSHSADDYRHQRDDMDSLKNHIYDDIKGMIFNFHDNEWLHAGAMLSFYYMPQESLGNKGQTTTYSAISIDMQSSSPDIILIHYISVPDIIDSIWHENEFIKDPSKFNVNDNIELTTATDPVKAQQAYDQAQNDVNSLISQKNDLDNQIKSLTDHINQSQAKVNVLTKSINDLSTKLANAKNDKQNVEHQIVDTTKRINDLQAAYPALLKAKDDIAQDLATYKQDHAAVINDYNNTKSQLEKLNNDLDAANKDKNSAETILNQHKAELARINQDLDAANKQIDDLKVKLADAKTAQTAAKANLDKAQADYDNYVNTHKDLIDQISAADKVVSEKKEAVQKAQAAYDKAEADYKTAKAEVTKLDNKVQDLDKTITKSQATIKTLTNRIAANTKIINNNKQVHEAAARKAFDAQINQALDAVVAAPMSNSNKAQAATVKPTVNNTKHALPQTSVDDKVSIFAALAGLSLASIGLGSLVSDKKRRRN